MPTGDPFNHADVEMDTLTPTHERGPIRVGVLQANSVARARLDKKNYTLGIVLLLVVVFLWTSSNFVTQVSGYFLFPPITLASISPRTFLRVDTRSRSCSFQSSRSVSMDSQLPCSVTYMNTSAFSFYLIPWLGKWWWSRLKGGSGDLKSQG